MYLLPMTLGKRITGTDSLLVSWSKGNVMILKSMSFQILADLWMGLQYASDRVPKFGKCEELIA